jgi:RNA polymerase sigma-70 factor (ECF subfamily)
MNDPLALRAGGTLEWDWDDLRLRCLRETRRVLGHGVAAEDATQEALIRAWRSRASCQDPRRPGPWISTIARREALRIAGRHARDRSTDEQRCEAAICAGSPPEWDAGSEVRTAVVGLPPDDRWLLFAHYWEDRPCRELSRELGCPEATVRVRLHRLRGRLREALRD